MVEMKSMYVYYKRRPILNQKVQCPLEDPMMDEIPVELCHGCGYHIRTEDNMVSCSVHWL